MDILYHLGSGFVRTLSPMTFVLLAVGVLVGMIFALLPGLTAVIAVILVLPFTYTMSATNAIIIMTAIYVGGTYGGAFTAILFNIPGDPIHVPMLWDGYPMARKGQAAKALGWTLYAAAGGGLIAAIFMVAISEPFAHVALTFSTPEYFAIVLLGLASVIMLGTGTLRQAVVSLAIGLLVACVGIDDIYGAERFTFGSDALRNGIDYLPVMVGAYALSEVLSRLEQGFASPTFQELGKVKTSLPRLTECKRQVALFLRSIGIGTLIGIVPGAGATVASFVSYGVEKQYGKNRAKMGKGAAEGIVSSQAAATSSVGGALIPLLTLGIPGSGVTAVMLGAFLLHGIQPGPRVFTTNIDLVYAIYASVFVSIAVMALFGYLAVKPMCKVLHAPEAVSSAFIMVLCFVGALTIRNDISDVWIMVAFGIIGYFMQRFKYPVAPMVLGSILGPLAERAFMTTMISYSNDWTVFFTRPISGAVMGIIVVGLPLSVIYPMVQKSRQCRRSVDAEAQQG